MVLVVKAWDWGLGLWGQETTGEGASSVAVKGPGLKGSCREGRGYWSKCNSVIVTFCQLLATPALWRCQYHGMAPRNSSKYKWSQPEPRRQAVWAAEGGAWEVIPDIRHWIIYTVVLLCFDCDCALVLPSRSKYLTFYCFHRSPCFKNFELLRGLRILKEILNCLKRLIIKCLTL